MSEPASVIERLRAETRAAHTQVAERPLFGALAEGSLPLASYVGLLHALCIVYEQLEQTLAQQPPSPVWSCLSRKLPLLLRDLSYLERQGQPLPVADVRAQLLAQRIRTHAESEPAALLGYLYALAGPPIAELLPHRQVGRVLGLHTADGLRYLASYSATTLPEPLARTLAQPAPQVAAAASEALVGLGQIVEPLYPLPDQPPRDLVRMLNPDAGTHAIPTDPRELQAALRAGERSWRQFPYYEWRYASRGEQFTRSDSAWLVTLADYAPSIVMEQVMWLGRVLASRGMPRWMLELHLELLYEELIAAVPEKESAYASLRLVAERLREQRLHQLSEEQFQRLTAAFDAQVGPEWSARLPQTGGLLAAAVTDERSGIAQAVASISEWMRDPARFPAVWIAAVKTTISAAREQAR